MRSPQADLFYERLMKFVERHPTLRREFADYQCNARPGDLKKQVPKFYDQLVLTGVWSERDLMAAVVGVVCQRMGLRLKTLTMALEDPSLQRPNPKFARKKKVNNSPSARKWRAERKADANQAA